MDGAGDGVEVEGQAREQCRGSERRSWNSGIKDTNESADGKVGWNVKRG